MTLLVLAAGIGSRYGGLKQMEPMGPSGETLLDYSVYDAVRAGFRHVVFIIRRDFESAFRREIAARFDSAVQVDYAYQALEDIPAPFAVPSGRTKPWGTAHAVLCARDLIDDPFAVINADDFYGLAAYQRMREFLSETPDRDDHDRAVYGMAGYRMDNTLSDFGAVARGLCEVDAQSNLVSVTELTGIRRDASGPYCTSADGSRQSFTGKETVSMNFWAFRPSLFPLLESLFRTFLGTSGTEQASEFYIPSAVDTLIRQNRARVRVVLAEASWFGVTYPEDKPLVRESLRRLVETGAYPCDLWATVPAPPVNL